MAKVRCKVLKIDEYTKLIGEPPKGSIVKLDYKESLALIKKGVVELSDLQRDIEGGKTESIKVNKSPELIEFLKQVDLLDQLTNEVHKTAVGEAEVIKTIILVAVLSKVINKRPTSANLCLNAASGTGKDFIAGETLNIFPEKFIFARRRISQKALDYALAAHQGRDWNNFIIFLEDVSNAILNCESVKTLMSARSDKINIVTVVVDGSPKDLKIQGKPGFIASSAKIKSADETLRRLPFCYLDESQEQTFAINLKQAEEDARGKKNEQNKLIRDFFLGLGQVTVINPFAEEIARKLANHWIQKSNRSQVIQRTIFPRFLDYIKASACLHQYQREKDKEGNVIAKAPDDYNNARMMLLQTTSNSLMLPLSREEKELVETLIKEFPDGESVKEINLKVSRWEERWLRNNLDRLVTLGFIVKDKRVTNDSDKPVAIYIPQADILKFSIPTWEELQNTTSGANGTNATTGTIGANTNAIYKSKKKQLHQLHSKIGLKTFDEEPENTKIKIEKGIDLRKKEEIE